MIFTNMTNEAVSINNSGGTAGSFDIMNSTVFGLNAAFTINDGGTINITNTIIANTGYAYVAHDNIEINPNHNLLFNVTTISATTSSGHVSADPAQLIGNPLFVNSAGGDFHLQSGSQAIDSGVDVGLPFPGAAPDRGAFEFSGNGGGTIPEPSTFALLGLGGIGLAIRAIRRRRHTAAAV